jgi:PAS domain-containing protein
MKMFFFARICVESEKRHRLRLQTAMDGFLRAGMQGRVFEVNGTYCRTSGNAGRSS